VEAAISAHDARLVRAVLLNTTVTVYGRGAGGRFTTVLQTDLTAGFTEIDRRGAATAPDRAELAALRELHWDPIYALPETSQVEDTAGVRWNPIAGTFGTWAAGEVVIRHCDVVRAKA
jgi:hypothetical protein